MLLNSKTLQQKLHLQSFHLWIKKRNRRKSYQRRNNNAEQKGLLRECVKHPPYHTAKPFFKSNNAQSKFPPSSLSRHFHATKPPALAHIMSLPSNPKTIKAHQVLRIEENAAETLVHFRHLGNINGNDIRAINPPPGYRE